MENKTCKLSKYLDCIFASSEGLNWFGYYNYCPINKDNTKLICHRSILDAERDFNKDDIIEVGWYSLVDSTWHHIAYTDAANWQQGAMSQWIVINGDEKIIFNISSNGKYISKIYNIDGSHFKDNAAAIYGINNDALLSITINFERAHWCRAYHYESIQNHHYNTLVSEVDGVYSLNIMNNYCRRIIDIDRIVNIDPDPCFGQAKHWIEHIMLNRSGTRFAFYHRFDYGNGFKTRCFISDIDGKELWMVPDWRNNSWSHLGWIDDDVFVIFGVKRKSLGVKYSNLVSKAGSFGTIIKKIYRTLFARFVSKNMHNKVVAGSNYQIYKVGEGRIGCFEKGMLVNDGHPSFTKDGRFMLTDTYADDQGYRNLLLYNINKNKVVLLGRFYSPINNTGYRCDLHPRFSSDETLVIIDSAHTGKHQTYVFRVNWALLRK